MTARALGPERNGTAHVAAQVVAEAFDLHRPDANTMIQERIVGKHARCVYCGWPCYRRTCAAHRDLWPIDPLL